MKKTTGQNGIPHFTEGPLRGVLDALVRREWLLTNGRGDFSFGSVLGGSTRKYHGLLVGSKKPPLERYVLLAGTVDVLTSGKKQYALSSWEFNHAFEPDGWKYLSGFDPEPDDRDDPGASVEWCYEAGGFRVTRRVTLLPGKPAVRVRYRVTPSTSDAWTFELSPLLAMRDFHKLLRRPASDPWEVQFRGKSMWIQSSRDRDVTLGLCVEPVSGEGKVELQEEQEWWQNVFYRIESDREYLQGEDLQRCGTYRISARGAFSFDLIGEGFLDSPDHMGKSLSAEPCSAVGPAEPDPIRKRLVRAADAFVVHRETGQHKGQATILAGYPWFGDWGRDTFIALEGLLLCTNRFEEARQVLATFAGAQRNGLIPNRFDDYGGECDYNSVDASLWYIHAADVYLTRSNDTSAWDVFMSDVCRKVVEAFVPGTDYEIGLQPNGLIWCGYPGTQITWMDAKCGDVVFTPRHGQPVEVNALWYHGLRILQRRFAESDSAMAERCREMADRCREQFGKTFWNEEADCLYDVIRHEDKDGSIRPNQVFAVSLEHSPLAESQQKSVMRVVKRHLLTPFGLRSLSPLDSKYLGQCAGIQFDRDRAYHNGTVWSWLIGPYCEAVLRLSNHDEKAKHAVRGLIQPLIEHLDETGLGSVSEIFDGDAPHAPGGCPAQAWSIAELLRIHDLVSRE